MEGDFLVLTIDWVPQSVNGKLKVTESADVLWGRHFGLWSEEIQSASRFRGGTVAFLGMVM